MYRYPMTSFSPRHWVERQDKGGVLRLIRITRNAAYRAKTTGSGHSFRPHPACTGNATHVSAPATAAAIGISALSPSSV